MIAPRSCATDESESEVSSGIGLRFSSAESDAYESSEDLEATEKLPRELPPIACTSCRQRRSCHASAPPGECKRGARPPPLPHSLKKLIECTRLRKLQRAERRQKLNRLRNKGVQKVSIGIQTSPRDMEAIDDARPCNEEQESVSNEDATAVFNPLETEMDLSQVSSITSERVPQKPRSSFPFNVNAPPFGVLDPYARPFFPQTLRR